MRRYTKRQGLRRRRGQEGRERPRPVLALELDERVQELLAVLAGARRGAGALERAAHGREERAQTTVRLEDLRVRAVASLLSDASKLLDREAVWSA